MKLNELITEFDIYMTNEERALYEQLDQIVPIITFNERQRVIVNNLIRKSLVSKIRHNNQIMVARNDQQTDT
jgi:hypothetical protein